MKSTDWMTDWKGRGSRWPRRFWNFTPPSTAGGGRLAGTLCLFLAVFFTASLGLGGGTLPPESRMACKYNPMPVLNVNCLLV